MADGISKHVKDSSYSNYANMQHHSSHHKIRNKNSNSNSERQQQQQQQYSKHDIFGHGSSNSNKPQKSSSNVSKTQGETRMDRALWGSQKNQPPSTKNKVNHQLQQPQAHNNQHPLQQPQNPRYHQNHHDRSSSSHPRIRSDSRNGHHTNTNTNNRVPQKPQMSHSNNYPNQSHPQQQRIISENRRKQEQYYKFGSLQKLNFEKEENDTSNDSETLKAYSLIKNFKQDLPSLKDFEIRDPRNRSKDRNNNHTTSKKFGELVNYNGTTYEFKKPAIPEVKPNHNSKDRNSKTKHNTDKTKISFNDYR